MSGVTSVLTFEIDKLWVFVLTMHKKKSAHLCTHITSKRIELESPGWSGLVKFYISFKI